MENQIRKENAAKMTIGQLESDLSNQKTVWWDFTFIIFRPLVLVSINTVPLGIVGLHPELSEEVHQFRSF